MVRRLELNLACYFCSFALKAFVAVLAPLGCEANRFLNHQRLEFAWFLWLWPEAVFMRTF